MEFLIEKLVYGGDGLARMPADDAGPGKAVFVPFVLAGERVEATVVEQKSGFARARLERVLAPSPERVEPPCPYFARCGGCHYQQARYEHQLQMKSEVLRENLRRLARLDWAGEITIHPSPPWNYRNRTRLQIRTAPEFVLAYYRFGSHELLPVEQCPISSPLINRAIAAVWELGRAGKIPAVVGELEIFADHDDARLLLEFYVDAISNSESAIRPAEWKQFWNALSAALPEVAGAAAVARPRNPGDERRPTPLARWAAESLTYRVGNYEYWVSTGSFFQTNRFLSDQLVHLVAADARGTLALDLYAGVGLFARPLAESFETVIAVESNSAAAGDLRENSPENIRVVGATTEEFVKRPMKRVPDLVVVDPPRAGLGERVSRRLAELGAPRLTYVSCDPATLARDLRVLLEAGYGIEQLHLLDLFPQTFHIESVVKLVLG